MSVSLRDPGGGVETVRQDELIVGFSSMMAPFALQEAICTKEMAYLWQLDHALQPNMR
jgi:hypothetical protein